jgi:hypothetical protein
VLVSAIKGRVRLRSLDFKKPHLDLKELKEVPGVTNVEHNPRTGSLLILYDPTSLSALEAAKIMGKLDPTALQTYLEYKEKSAARQNNKPDGQENNPNRIDKKDLWDETISLSFTLLSLVVSGFVGTKKIHILVGLFFLELVAKHLWRYRKRLKLPKKTSLGDYLRPRPFRGGPKTPKSLEPPIMEC